VSEALKRFVASAADDVLRLVLERWP